MTRHCTVTVIAAILALAACSSRPREFVPSLKAAPVDEARYEVDYEKCRTLVAKGQRSGFGAQIASAGTGVAAGVGVPLGIAALGEAATYAVASTAVVLMPLVGVGAAWGMAKKKKSRKEREIKQATALCLSEHGYAVADWEVAKRRAKPIAAKGAASRAIAAAAESDAPPPRAEEPRLQASPQ